MPFNFYAVFVSTLVTLVVGFVWYNPKVFGTIWMKETGMTEEKQDNPVCLRFSIDDFFLFYVGFLMPVLVIHQFGALGMIGGPEFIETAKPSYAAFMADYGTAFRSFKHGALHGCMTGLFLHYR